MNKLKTSWQTKFLAILLMLGLVPFFTVVVLATIPLCPVTFNSVTIANPNKTVKAGEKILYIVDSVKHTDKPAKIIRQLINERTIFYTAIDGNVPPGASLRGYTLTTSTADIPGVYYLRETRIYKYFFFRDVAVAADSEHFMITK